MPAYSDLKNKVVVVTGGAQGIGAATVRAFVAQGARVFFCDLVAAEIADATGQVVDLAVEKQIISWIQRIGRTTGRIDVLVNNAAVDPRIPLADLTRAKVEQLFTVNLHALFTTIRESAPRMPKGSAIVNFSSITFHLGPANMSAYVATKAAVIGLTRSVARELGPRGIRVNVVSPGWTMTERQLRQYVDARTKRLIRRSQCIPELLLPGDIAEVVLFLASDASRALTGQEILADRGWAHS